MALFTILPLETAVLELFICDSFSVPSNNMLRYIWRAEILFLCWASCIKANKKHQALSAQVNRNCKYDFLRSVVDRAHIVSIDVEWLNLFTIYSSFFGTKCLLFVWWIGREIFDFHTEFNFCTTADVIECKCLPELITFRGRQSDRNHYYNRFEARE